MYEVSMHTQLEDSYFRFDSRDEARKKMAESIETIKNAVDLDDHLGIKYGHYDGSVYLRQGNKCLKSVVIQPARDGSRQIFLL